MSYTITIEVDKPISREETKALLDSFPKWCHDILGDSDEQWGFVYALDIMFERGSEPKKEVELHGAYGTPFESFLIETIQQLCKAGYRIVNVDLNI